jgi:hypothetical protein
MADQDEEQAGAENKKKKFYGRYARGMALGRTTNKSKVAGLEDDTFDVGAASNPAKFSKSLNNLENYIHVGVSQCTRKKQTRDRQSVGMCRVLARSGSQQKDRRLVKNQ